MNIGSSVLIHKAVIPTSCFTYGHSPLSRFHLEIVPRGGKKVIFLKGLRKGLDILGTMLATTALIKGLVPQPSFVNETLPHVTCVGH